MSRWAIGAMIVCLAVGVRAETVGPWACARNAHFEVYSQAGTKSAVSGLAWLEELRAFVAAETGLDPDGPEPLRVIAFRSETDYAPYRVESLADAYYVGWGSRNYVVLPSLEADELSTAAHEYSHFLFHLAGLELPAWLREGMAEVFSSVHVSAGRTRIGGNLDSRADLLRRNTWKPMERILAWSKGPPADSREEVELFYSESWALTEMLALAPEYRSGFRTLVNEIAAGTPAETALRQVYGKSLERVAEDLRDRAGHRAAVPLANSTDTTTPVVTASAVPDFEMRVVLGRMLLVAGDFERAGRLYGELSGESPSSADVSAGLSAVALASGDQAGARRLWKQAMEQGLADAEISYLYAFLLDKNGGATDDMRSALQLTIRQRPSLGDARFRLALLEENSGRHAAALEQFDYITDLPPERRYFYWCGRAQALLGMGRNEEAAKAAENAVLFASNSEERGHGLEIIRQARTHPEVQFTRDAAGKLLLSTTRVPNDAAHWNAFIEPGDDLQRAEGTLAEIECGDAGLRLLVDTASGRIAIAIPDPARVELRNAPADFVCGPQTPRPVVVEYAADRRKGTTAGVARGIEFVGEKK